MTYEPQTALRLGTSGPAETQAVAEALATVLRTGDLLVLTGDLGAGKTCFTQGLGRGLGIEERLTSPTFTLANRYHGRLTLHHLDVYRLNSVAETMDLGLTELLEDGVTVIEWGDRIEEVLPTDHLTIALRYPDVSVGSEPSAAQTDSERHPATVGELSWDDLELNQREIELSAAGANWSDRALENVLSGWLDDEAAS